MAERKRFRHSFYKLLPQWLLNGEGELVAYSLTRIIDAFDETWRAGLEARFPSFAGDAALDLIGRDRRIFRGRTEARAHYVGRLKRWRWPRGHRTRGSAFALLEQIAEYWGGMLVVSYDVNQNFHERDATGAETYAYGQTWNWDGDTASWSRFWIVMYPSPAQMKPWPKLLGAWGGSMRPGRGFTLGQQGVTPDDVRAMRRLLHGDVAVWKPAGTQTDYAVIALDPAPPTNPAGLWGTLRGRVTNAPAGLRFWRIG